MEKSELTISIADEEQRKRAHKAVDRAPIGMRIMFFKQKRSIPQNARMWAILKDVSQQVEYYGKYRSPEDWKDIFTAALRVETEIVPTLDGAGFIQLGQRTSKMSKDQMANLIELMQAYCAEHGVELREAA